MRDGGCWEQRTLEQTTRGTESGLLPNGVDSFHTPNTKGLNGGSNSMKALKKRQEKWAALNASDNKDRMLPTPTAHNAKECNSPSEKNRNTPTLATHDGGKLNPMWVEWLMGWPLGWTDLKPLEMDKSHSVPQQPGKF
jgi:hypothetical protein